MAAVALLATAFPAAALDAFQANRMLGRGMNMGNALEAPREGEWGITLTDELFAAVAHAGFDSVRIPVRWSAHADRDHPYRIDPGFMERVAWAVDTALGYGLAVVVNVHHYSEVMHRPGMETPRYHALWRQLGRRFADHPPNLFFELLNEPSSQLDAAAWNRLLASTIDVVRESNPDRVLIIGAANFSQVAQLEALRLPEGDRGLIASIHYYEPLKFTQQGASWLPGAANWRGTAWEGSREQRERVVRDLGAAASWGHRARRPLYLGEFGVISHADADSRRAWIEWVARSAESLGISWAYWELASNFAVYNRSTASWNEELLDALNPE